MFGRIAMAVAFGIFISNVVFAAPVIEISTNQGTYNVGDVFDISVTATDGGQAVKTKTVTCSLAFTLTGVAQWKSFGKTDDNGVVTWNNAVTVGERWYSGIYNIKATLYLDGTGKKFTAMTTVTVVTENTFKPNQKANKENTRQAVPKKQ